METETEIIRTELPNGARIYVRATVLGGKEYVAAGLPSFKGVIDALEGIAESAVVIWEKVKPSKACIEFGLEIALESGEITAMLVKGSGTADLRITLEWEK